MAAKKIFTVSASDRNNYGDLLFSHVLEYGASELGGDVQFIHTSTTKGDISYFGAFPVVGHRELVQGVQRADDNGENPQIIYAGGEALGTSWFTLLSFVDAYADYAYRSPILRRVLRKTKGIQHYFQRRYGTAYPFIPSEWEAEKVPFTYNSIGVSALRSLLKQDKSLIERLRKAKHFSVRDERSSRVLKEFEIPHQVVPDSALLMKEIFESQLLQHSIPQRVGNAAVVVQINPEKGPRDLRQFATVIEHAAREISAPIILLPIGLARRHDDIIALKRLKEHLPNSELYVPEHLLDIMKIISQCQLYIGTSLHGSITAQAFQRPMVGLCERVPKLKSYLETWGKSDFLCLTYEDLPKAIPRALVFEYDETEEHRQRELVWDSLRAQLLG